MSDWPQATRAPRMSLNTLSQETMVGQEAVTINSTAVTASAWPTANTAIYTAFWLDYAQTVYKMSFIVATASGNYDVGIYDFAGTRIVNKGSTAVPAAGMAIVDITDTFLNPGMYYMAMNCDNTTATFNRLSGIASQQLRVCGVATQAVGAVTLPTTATFANPSASYVPWLVCHFTNTV